MTQVPWRERQSESYSGSPVGHRSSYVLATLFQVAVFEKKNRIATMRSSEAHLQSAVYHKRE